MDRSTKKKTGKCVVVFLVEFCRAFIRFCLEAKKHRFGAVLQTANRWHLQKSRTLTGRRGVFFGLPRECLVGYLKAVYIKDGLFCLLMIASSLFRGQYNMISH